MRNIRKGREPRSLTEYKKHPGATYEGYSQKDDLRRSLVQEQKGLCCYCMSRIRADRKHMKIEHWQSQSPEKYPERQLDYTNLLGACLGGKGKPKKFQHCDTLKGDKNLSFNPANPADDVERLFKFLGDGRIVSDDAMRNEEINKILNLNHPILIQNRKAVLDAFKERLGKAKLDPHKELPKWDGNHTDELPEYSQVIVYWLRKKIK